MMIEVRRLEKRFGLKPILQKMDFLAEKGDIVAIIGPNGAGKTTFLRILATLSRPTSGQVIVGDFRLPQQAVQVRQLIGFVSHQPMLYGDLTPEENLLFFSRLYGITDAKERIRNTLEQVGLAASRKIPVRTFSRGMQQRLSIGRAVLHDPELLLLDEPHTGLDQDANEMLDLVLRNIALRGRTVLLTSHDLLRVGDLANRVDVLSKGRIVASASQSQISSEQIPVFYRRALSGEPDGINPVSGPFDGDGH